MPAELQAGTEACPTFCILMPNITLSIPHQLPRAEVKRRVQTEITRLRQQYGDRVARMEERWTGDTLAFTVHALGTSITGTAVIEDKEVRVEIAVPWMLKMFAGGVKGRIEQEGRKLLAP